MFNATATQTQITAVLKELGQQVTLVKASGSRYKAYGVWSKTESADSLTTVTSTIVENKVLYMSGALPKPPESGDTIEFGKSNWGVLTVEAYKPAAIVIAYKVIMAN